MKRPKQKHTSPFIESLLGGAAIGISDLLMIESNEIKWSLTIEDTKHAQVRRTT